MALISFFVNDLATNAIVRAAPLAEALRQEGHQVEIIGFVINGTDVYAPYRDRFLYKTIQIKGTLRGQIQKLARMAEGDLIYACKPLITTFLPALLSSRLGLRRPLLLDVEDDELWLDNEPSFTPITKMKKILRQYWNLRKTYAIQPLTRFASAVTVVGRTLQRRYGGVIILHGPDEGVYDPTRPELDTYSCRKRFKLPLDDPLVLFAGIPHKHKGLDMLIDSLRDSRLRHLKVVLAGPVDHPAFLSAKNMLPGRVLHLGVVTNDQMPQLLAAINIVPTPQLINDFTEAQIPAKLLEAMAMGKSVVASRVSDLPILLGEHDVQPRGWIHTPGDVNGLADCLANILNNPEEARRRGRAAREYFVANAGINAIRSRLRPIFNSIMKGYSLK